jgi:3',5'-cyclic AMP phosphodiesterase CpdA
MRERTRSRRSRPTWSSWCARPTPRSSSRRATSPTGTSPSSRSGRRGSFARWTARWPARLLRPFDEFRRRWAEVEPVYRSERLVVCGLNSVRPWKHQGGALRRGQLEHAARVLADAPPGALKVVALHHHLIGAPWRSRKRPVAARASVLGALVDAGAELIVSGHVHQSAVGERREFEVAAGPVHGTTVVTAPGLGQPRPRRRGEARGLHLFEADERTLRVLTYAWVEHRWAQIADRRFPRGTEPLSAIG